jgi:hypothetical protein
MITSSFHRSFPSLFPYPRAATSRLPACRPGCRHDFRLPAWAPLPNGLRHPYALPCRGLSVRFFTCIHPRYSTPRPDTERVRHMTHICMAGVDAPEVSSHPVPFHDTLFNSHPCKCSHFGKRCMCAQTRHLCGSWGMYTTNRSSASPSMGALSLPPHTQP